VVARPCECNFYDVAQALAVLVDLPDGRHVLVDTGDQRSRAGCGDSCATAGDHLLTQLARDLSGSPISLLWITHPHTDHLGGAVQILRSFRVEIFADNGRDTQKPEVKRTHEAARASGARLVVIDPQNSTAPIASSATVRITPIVPSAWPSSCAHHANECSIGLRIDYCASSVLFTGDAEAAEEPLLPVGGPVTLLQVGHHGSGTSSTADFLAAREAAVCGHLGRQAG
jgi:competence protein ComEC